MSKSKDLWGLSLVYVSVYVSTSKVDLDKVKALNTYSIEILNIICISIVVVEFNCGI